MSQETLKPTIDALARRDHTVATEEKFAVEDEQRNLAKKRIDDGVEFHPKFSDQLMKKKSNYKI